MPLEDLTVDELIVVHVCLECVADGDVILHDWEFPVIMGIEVRQLRAVLDAWPDVDDSHQAVYLAINNSLNNLLGYPHRFHDDWDSRIPVPKAEVARVFSKWRGKNIDSYADGLE